MEGSAARRGVRPCGVRRAPSHRIVVVGYRRGAGRVLGRSLLRARPSQHPELPLFDCVHRHFRRPPTPLAPAAPGADLGELPRRILPGLADLRRVLHRCSTAPRPGLEARAGFQRGGGFDFGHQSQRLPRGYYARQLPAEPDDRYANGMVAARAMGRTVCVLSAALRRRGGASHLLAPRAHFRLAALPRLCCRVARGVPQSPAHGATCAHSDRDLFPVEACAARPGAIRSGRRARRGPRLGHLERRLLPTARRRMALPGRRRPRSCAITPAPHISSTPTKTAAISSGAGCMSSSMAAR